MQSRGILSLWNSKKFETVDVWAVQGAVGVEGKWLSSGKSLGIVNIYGPKESSEKIRLWNDLGTKILNNPGVGWCLIGKFNELRSCSERKGRNMYYRSSNLKRFEDFIIEARLTDVGLVGRKFTWSRLDGRCCSRIDRALVSSEWRV